MTDAAHRRLRRRRDGRMELYRHAGRMKMKQNRAGEVEYLTFPLLEQTGIVRHLFTTRLGGVSQGCAAA